MNSDWLNWAQRIQALAQAGITFTKDKYDMERYDELLAISAEMMACAKNLDAASVKETFVQQNGYQTPKIDVRGVVIKDNHILLVQEETDGTWALPGGYCEVGLSPAENIVKEIKEESGYDSKYERVLALFDTKKHRHPPHMFHFYKLVLHCTITGGTATTGVETSNVGFFSFDDLPPLSANRNTLEQFSIIRNQLNERQPYMD
ncbi:NUDIX hydrolase [Shouchella clausii]|uniref:ADP-ribose pyrophosphatase n=4 Tax=Shouchella TaxID=2893057 RepID=Q5WLD1_SHOC1|nr:MULTISPECIES: NUDIX hydrolase [Shouchella]MCM3314236.1 NUDIX hydrolase [Psychrobacillus sp. MER TA 17]ALA52611.1 MutT/nudix family protein [Shouchella clausii]KKI85479.1 ADP-ribose pyrophosphatase [Shouchella clausii]MBU3233184.1 NUDIX hydrolase [Shouchella clausii]MBU3266157.1 NUDIX hydrolase [Shouchella clausii]